jgi:predicted nucleic acid-binding Zn ribbon protein
MSGRAKYYRQGPARREPAPITDVLGTLMEQASARYGSSLVRLRGSWSTLAGEDWADTTPVAVQDDVVVVEVPDGGRASLLRFQADALLRAIQEAFGVGFASGIRLRVTRPHKGR